jgi:methionyl-tRNA formyltransferase
MRIVLITGQGTAHRYMANRLAAEIPLVAIVVDQGPPVSPTARVKRLWRRYTLRQIVGRICLRALRIAWRDGQRMQEQLRRVFGSENPSEFKHHALVQHVSGINTAEGYRVVSALNPDTLLVFGTGIVGGRILRLARTIALNVHTGLSPYYRGAECTFWPLHNGEPHMLGVTVHECTQRIDGGDIYATGRVKLEADDCMHAVYGRCVVTAADLYIRVVKDLLRGHLDRTPQELSIGHEYRAHMHGLRAELKVRRMIKAGLIRRYVQKVENQGGPSDAMVGV